MNPFDPTPALKALATRYDPEFFVSGNCHHLALALFEAAGGQGQISACIRHHIIADSGREYMSNYSHMVWTSLDGEVWDIDGDKADERWEELFDNREEPDEDGLLSEFEWIDLTSDQVPTFLTEWNSTFDRTVVDEVKKVIAQVDKMEITPEEI